MSNTAPPPPPPQGPSAQPASQWGPPAGSASKAGIPLWGKIAMGCGCLLVLGVIALFALGAWGVKKVADSEAGASIGKAVEAAKAFADNDPARAAELLIEANPEFEVVENDPDNGRIRVKIKSSGDIGTIDYSEIEKGRFTFESDNGASFQVDGSEASEGVVTYTDSEGNTGRIGMAQELPAFVPVYPGANVQEGGGFQGEQGGKITGLSGFSSTDSFDQVADWYETNLAEQGYEVEKSTMSAGGSRVVSFAAKKEGAELNIAVAQEDGKQELAITTQYSGNNE